MSHDDMYPRLLINSGLHAGAECALPQRPFTIGADAAADVILHDENIAPIHVVLEPDGDDLRVIIRAPGVTIEDTVLEAGETVISALPVSIMLGTVELRCEGAGTALAAIAAPENRVAIRSAAALLPRTTLGRAAGAGLLGIVVVGLVALRVFTGDGTPAHAASHVLPHVGDARTTDPAQIQRLTTAELEVLGLKGVSLSVDAGVVTATGQVDPAEMPKLHALELWFDRRFGDGAVLLSQVSFVKPEPLTVALQAVWSGPDPNVVIGGQRYGEGATLPDGSVVTKIGDNTVTLSREGRTFELGY